VQILNFKNVIPDTRGRQIVLIIAILAGFITQFDSSAVNIALPSIGNDFALNAILLSWVTTSYLLATAAFLITFGKVSDIYGREKVFRTGIIVFTIASFGLTLVPSAGLLIAMRVVQGIGSAMIFGTAVAILTNLSSPGERGKVLGIYITAVYFGLSAGPLFGGLLTHYLGWRSIFLINVPIGIIAALLTTRYLKNECIEGRKERFDIVGAIVYGISIFSLMFGFSRVPDPLGISILAAGVIGLLIFLIYESRVRFPVLDVRIFLGNKVFALSNLAALISYSSTYAVTFLLSLYLQYTQNLTADKAGLILIAQPVMMALISSLSGRLSDTIEPRIVASIGMAITTTGLFLLIFLSAITPLWYLIVSLVIIGIGYGLFTSPNTNAVMSSVEQKVYGVANGIIGTVRLLGQILSMGIATMIFSIIIGHVIITPDYYPQFMTSLSVAFTFFTVFCFFGIFASLVRGKIR